MKKLLLLLSIALISINLFAEKVSREDAETVAKNYYFQQYNLFNAPIEFGDIVFTSVIKETINNEVALYVFNMEKGYIIVSAEDAVTPVIAYSWESTYPTQDNYNFRQLISDYINMVQFVRENNLEANFEVMSRWNEYATSDPSALLNTKDVKDVPILVTATWNQDWPYNYYAPEDEASPAGGRTYAGCVATAMSMIMYYWQYPETGTGMRQYYQYPYGVLEANFGETHYQWDAMFDQISSNSSQEAIEAIAEIQYHCGIAVHMEYSPDGSGAFSPDVPAALDNYFRYNDAIYQLRSGMSNTAWDAMLVSELDNGRPLYHSGSSSEGGHAFVVDAYNYASGAYTFHYNFGWGGYGNAYFVSTSPDVYTMNHAVVKNFVPTEQYPNYASGPDTLTHKVGRFTDGSGPINNYQDNTSASWLINPQSANDSIEKITLYFDEFDLDASDVVKIYDGMDETAPLLAEFTGADSPSTQYSTGNTMFVTFNSDASGNATGMTLRYTTSIHAWCSGSTTFTEPTGNISDGSGDKNYTPNSMCIFIVKPTFASSVTLIFDSFETVDENDYLEIYDMSNSQLIVSLSGSDIPEPVTSPSGKMYIIWKTDNFDQAAGWNATWQTDNVGIENDNAFNEFQLFPNPATNSINISFRSADAKDLTVEILSTSGKMMFSETMDSFTGTYNEKVDVSEFAKGIYLMRINSNQGTAYKKIVIK